MSKKCFKKVHFAEKKKTAFIAHLSLNFIYNNCFQGVTKKETTAAPLSDAAQQKSEETWFIKISFSLGIKAKAPVERKKKDLHNYIHVKITRSIKKENGMSLGGRRWRRGREEVKKRDRVWRPDSTRK